MKIFVTSAAILMLLFAAIYLCRCQGCKQQKAVNQGGTPCLVSEKSGVPSRQLLPQSVVKAEEQAQQVRQSMEAACPPRAVSAAVKEMLQSAPKQVTGTALPTSDVVRLAAEKSQLMDDCERRISSSHSLLKRIADDPKENAVVRKSAFRALWALDGL